MRTFRSFFKALAVKIQTTHSKNLNNSLRVNQTLECVAFLMLKVFLVFIVFLNKYDGTEN